MSQPPKMPVQQMSYVQVEQARPAPPMSAEPMAVLIPYKNPCALIAYYLSVFSLILGPFLSIPAIVLGVIGLMARNRNPAKRGMGHAITGIVLGGLVTIGWVILIMKIAGV